MLDINYINTKEELANLIDFSKEYNVLMDTSGSMFGDISPLMMGVFGENKIFNLNVIATTDVEIVPFKIESLEDFETKLMIGGGGTLLNPSIEVFKSANKKLDMIIATDGYTDTLNFDDYEGDVIIINTQCECLTVKDYTNVKQYRLGDELYEELD